MKKYILVSLAFLFVTNTIFAQRLFEDEEEQGFVLKIVFKYKDLNAVEVQISDHYGSANDNNNLYDADINFRQTGCDFENDWNIPIASRYSYDQLCQYLVDIDIRTFKPQNNAHDVSADLQIKFMYLSSNQKNYNVFHWNYNPDNVGDENQILTYLFEVLDENVSIPCARDTVEKLESYIEE